MCDGDGHRSAGSLFVSFDCDSSSEELVGKRRLIVKFCFIDVDGASGFSVAEVLAYQASRLP